MSPTEAVCAECGAQLDAGQDRCWLCHRSVDWPALANPYAAPRPAGDVSAAQFSLESLFLITTLVAVGLGAFLIAPGLGILMAIVAVPALARTLLAGYRQKQAGAKLSAGQKIGTFVLSFVLIMAIGYAGCIAFFLVCSGIGLTAMAIGIEGEWIIAVIIGAASLAAISLIAFLLWVSGPRSVKR